MNWINLAQNRAQVTGCCENGDEPSSSTAAEELLSRIKDAGPRIYINKKFPALYGTSRSSSLHSIPSTVPVLSQKNPLTTVTGQVP